MKLELFKRHCGCHTLIRECSIKGSFKSYATKIYEKDDYKINEQKLLNAIPKNFLPCEPNQILLTIEENWGGTGQTGLTLFRNWAKYFDSYSLGLMKE